MTSAINPNNIDGAYPVAGQDNNSQGFRDNFTNTKTNFAYAADEITDLQNNAILKAALTGTTLNNDMNGSVLSNAQLQDMSETRSRWTVADEARLAELTERKERIMAENRQPVFDLVSKSEFGGFSSSLTGWLIANAEGLRDALEPFDGRGRA
jgi:hypothetical protein